MGFIYDGKQLSRMTADLHTLVGVRISILGSDGQSVCVSGSTVPFCELIQACPEGSRRCRACEALGEEAAQARRLHCHAGVCAAIQPVRTGLRAEPAARLCASRFLEASPSPEQRWEELRPALDWYPGNQDALRSAFLQLPRLSPQAMAALEGMLAALADSIRLRELIQPSGESDLRRLERFLDQHYTERLTLASVSAQLHIGRTRLCALAKELSGGETLFTMITHRRISAAKALLVQTDRPISAIAEAVGISDYNYFSKIFRSEAGASPSEFRKRARSNLDNLV